MTTDKRVCAYMRVATAEQLAENQDGKKAWAYIRTNFPEMPADLEERVDAIMQWSRKQGYRVVGGTAFNGPSEISRKVIHSILQQNPPAGGAEIIVTPTLEHLSGNPQEVIEILKELQEHDIQVTTTKKEPMLTCLPFYLDIYTTFTSAIARMTGEHKIPENTHTM